MKLTKSLLYPIGSLMFYLFILVVYGKMNKVTVARLTGHLQSDKRNILQINPKYEIQKNCVKGAVPVQVIFNEISKLFFPLNQNVTIDCHQFTHFVHYLMHNQMKGRSVQQKKQCVDLMKINL